jgi:OFA family oxalate/formate antiporter-like MFS transporter
MYMEKQKMNPGWVVAFAGLGINLALGVLYAWGVIASELRTGLGWSATWTQIPYMVACAVFALSMVPGGRMQDRVGPRPVVLIAAVLAGVGFLMSGLVLRVPVPLIEFIGLIIFFGFVFGAGMGLGYSAPTPAAKKWFPKKQKGLITGIVVSGFGLAPVYIAPLTTRLIASFGLSSTFMILGTGFFIIILGLSVFMRNPTEQHLVWLKENHPEKADANAGGQWEFDWKEALATKTFRRLWIMFCFGTFAGLLIIGQMRDIGTEQAHIASPFLLPIFYAIFNCTGRLACGFFSDWIGRLRSLMILFAIQVVTFIGFMFIQSSMPMIIGVSIVGFTFGGMLSLFPAATSDYFGMKNFGVNYGMMLTAWGVGGVFGPLLGGIVRDLTGTYLISYLVSAGLSLAGVILSLTVRAPDLILETPVPLAALPHTEAEVVDLDAGKPA